MRLVTFTDPNTNEAVDVNADVIFYSRFMPSHKSMILVSIGGALVPVKEDRETILTKLKEESNGQSEESVRRSKVTSGV